MTHPALLASLINEELARGSDGKMGDQMQSAMGDHAEDMKNTNSAPQNKPDKNEMADEPKFPTRSIWTSTLFGAHSYGV